MKRMACSEGMSRQSVISIIWRAAVKYFSLLGVSDLYVRVVV